MYRNKHFVYRAEWGHLAEGFHQPFLGLKPWSGLEVTLPIHPNLVLFFLNKVCTDVKIGFGRLSMVLFFLHYIETNFKLMWNDFLQFMFREDIFCVEIWVSDACANAGKTSCCWKKKICPPLRPNLKFSSPHKFLFSKP